MPRPSPPRPRWGLKGLDLGREGAATGHRTTKRRRPRHLVTRSYDPGKAPPLPEQPRPERTAADRESPAPAFRAHG
jgi:hypothetical protein